MPTAILAGIVLIAAVLFHLWTPKKVLLPVSASIYGLLVVMTGMLVIQSNGIDSPFIAIWMAVSVFAGLYGIFGLGAIFLLVNIYIISIFIGSGIAREDIVVAAIAGYLPMLISYILWNGRESLEEARDHDVSKLSKTLEQESSKADAIIEAIGDGVIVVNQTGEVLIINPAAQQMTGWSADDALHLHFDSILKLQDGEGKPVDNSLNPISRVLNVGQQVRENEICIITKSGKKIYAAFVVSPMGAAGEGAIAVFRDITKERDDERAQAEFISTASHEMRTPVASIEGYLGLALNPNTATIDEKARDFINKAHASAQHLGHLFQDLLDVSKADDGRLKEKPAVIDVIEFTREIVDGLRAKAEEKGLELTYKPDGTKSTAGTTVISPVLYAHVDRDHLREVIDNLVENGIKYTLEGSVMIDATATDEYVRVSIQDSGVGIPAEDMPHLFQKFYRVDNSDTREIGGTGLGLYLCRKLIEAMDGRIWVESEYKKGSTFHIEVPRLDRMKASEIMEREEIAKQQATPAPVDATTTNTAVALGTIEQSPEIPTPPPEPAPQPTPQQPLNTAPVTATQPTPEAQRRFGAVAYDTTTPPPEPAPQPTPVTQPAPQEIVQTVAAPQVQVAPVPRTVPVAQQRANVPLTALERNPEQYVVSRPTPPKT
ncbi:PAS domain-containing protein [Candidatus Saccharibacteria bacterium]|nr:PAS domain-containing protein [Candidatus Saccharibacteria bacterium]